MSGLQAELAVVTDATVLRVFACDPASELLAREVGGPGGRAENLGCTTPRQISPPSC